MFDQLKEIINKTKTKTDLAVVLISGVTGYILDAELNFLTLIEPSIVGPLFASGALGVKNLLEDGVVSLFDKKKMINKANNLIQILQKSEKIPERLKYIEEVNDKIQLFKGDLIDRESFEEFIKLVLKKIDNKG